MFWYMLNNFIYPISLKNIFREKKFGIHKPQLVTLFKYSRTYKYLEKQVVG